MFNFIKKLGNRIKNIFNRPNYKKLYKEAVKQQEKTMEQVSQLKEQISQMTQNVSQMTEEIKSLKQINEENQANIEKYNNWRESMHFNEEIEGQNTITGIRLDVLEKLFNRGDIRLGKYSTKKPNRYITTNPEFLDKWYEVIEKDKEGYQPKYDISSHIKLINKTLTNAFSGQAIFESYEYDDGEWQLFVLEDAMNKVFIAFDIEPATSDTIIRR